MTPLVLFLILLLLKSLAVLALAGLTLLALRRASAASRHLVCLLTLVALLALPLFSQSRFSLPVTVPLGGPPAPILGSQKLGEGPLAQSSGTEPDNTGTEGSQETASPASAAPVPAPQNWGGGASLSSPARSFPWPATLLALWLLGVLAASVRPLLGLWGIGQLARRSRPETTPAVQALAAECAAALGLSRVPAVRRGDVPVPITWGLRRPVVLLPEAASAWPEGRLEAVLLHELAHIRRRDWAAHRLADLACALYWFHPLVWLTARRLRAEGEIACDDLVLSSGVSAPDYARHLLDIARALSPASPAVPAGTVAMARTAQVEGRITMILKPNTSRRALTRRTLLLALLPATTAVGIVAALRPAAVAEAALFQHTFPNGAVLERGADSGTGKTAAPLVLILRYALNSQPQAILTAAPDFKEDYLSRGNGVYLRQPILWTWGSGGSLQTKMLPETVTTASQGTARYQFPVKPETAISPLFIGVAAGPWTLSVDGPKKDGKMYLAQPSGQVIWTLLRHTHQDGALLMVSDHFRTHSPFPAENDVQVAFYDAQNYERVIYALDKKGQVLSELYGTRLTTPDEDYQSKDYYQSIKTEQTIHIPSALLRRTAKFRLVARPYEWTKLRVNSASAKR